MRRLRSITLLGLVIVTGAITAPAAIAAPGLPLGGLGFLHFTFKRVCAVPSAGHAACNAILATPTTAAGSTVPAAKPLATGGPPYGPADLQSAYNLPSSSAGSGQTVAIVDAYNDPNAAADLATYRTNYGLPACTTSNACFKQVGQTGTSSLPSNNASWSQEISLDLDMVSAICPNCHILLVEASSATDANLAAAANEAAKLGATQISNSYGGSEFSGETSTQSAYDHPGIDVTASTGDSGYGVEFPAASQYVTAVGGTSLTRATGTNPRGWTESVWSTSASEGAGSGCSAYIAKPAWQPTLGGCANRTVGDVSADANPATGVAVYDSYAYQGASGWLQFGGTSVASPIIASVDALAGGRAKTPYSFGQYPYLNAGQFYDVTTGSNGSCSPTAAYLCTAEVGYDGPTGIGTPDGAAPATPPSAPTNMTPPTISPTAPVVGQPLTASPGTWTGSPTFTYQWNCSATCAGVASGATYTPGSGDFGSTISVTVTATNSVGSNSSTSSSTGPVTRPAAPTNTSPPAISPPAPVVGQPLTASPGTWTGSPTFTYQWNCSATCTGAASGSTYTPGAGDAGHTIYVAVTASNAGGSVSANSPSTGPVTALQQSFTLSASPTSKSVNRTKSASYSISVAGKNGFSGPVSFTASGLSTGITASFSPASSMTGTTLTLSSTTAATTGAHTITIKGTSGGLTGSTSVSLTLTSCFLGVFC